MSTIITKYSDYALNSIEYFIDAINTELNYRDIKGLTNNKVEKINILKQHPLASLMAAQLQESHNADVLRSSIIPAISVTPGSPGEEPATLGQGLQTGIIDDDFIDNLKVYLTKTLKERLNYGILTNNQINLILADYKKYPDSMLYQIHEWRRSEEINVSAWSDTADVDILIGNILDSLLAEIQMGFVGDEAPIVNFKYRITKGLTNFNYGRILFGSEYSLTFLNTFTNYTIYREDRITDFESDLTFTTSGEE